MVSSWSSGKPLNFGPMPTSERSFQSGSPLSRLVTCPAATWWSGTRVSNCGNMTRRGKSCFGGTSDNVCVFMIGAVLSRQSVGLGRQSIHFGERPLKTVACDLLHARTGDRGDEIRRLGARSRKHLIASRYHLGLQERRLIQRVVTVDVVASHFHGQHILSGAGGARHPVRPRGSSRAGRAQDRSPRRLR